MDGMSQRLEYQKAHSTKLLNYGHLGTITYDGREKTWETLRIVEPQFNSDGHNFAETGVRSAFPLQHLTSRVVYEGCSGPQHGHEAGLNENDLAGHHESTSGPTTTCNPNSRRGNRSQHSESSFRDTAFMLAGKQSPNISALLAFGNAVFTISRGEPSEFVYVPIAVSISGSNGQSIRMVRMKEEATVSLDPNSEASSLHVSYISDEDQSFWMGSGTPVQQICFAGETQYQSTWMAARLQSSTTIFHPFMHRKAMPTRCETSRFPVVLDTNPIITIPISRTGGHPHADVAFHPKDHSRFALIDEHGNWSVWLVDAEHRESLHARFWASLICFGKIWTWNHEKRLEASLPYHDSWHRISWCTSHDKLSDKLLICNRRIAAVYSTSGNLLGLEDLLLGHARENQSILDVQLSRFVPGQCFVLTSTRLFWLKFHDTASMTPSKGRDILEVLLSWQHFRDRGDMTLRLVLLETGMTTVVLITSRIVDLVLVFRVGLVNGDTVLPQSLTDPLPIDLPTHPHQNIAYCRPYYLIYRAVECRQEGAVAAETRNPFMFKLFSLHEDLSVVEHHYRSTEPGFGPKGEEALSSILRVPNHKSLRRVGPKSCGRRGLQGLIVPDDWEVEISTETERNKHGRISKTTRPGVRARHFDDWQDVYAHLIDEIKIRASKSQTSVDALLRELTDHSLQPRLLGISLLSELSPCRLHVADVDDDSEQAESFIAKLNSQQGGELKVERLPTLLSEEPANSTLSSIYDAIVSMHLTPLAPLLPDRVRVNKERLARKVTADLFLASTALYLIPSTPIQIANWDAVPERATSPPAATSALIASTTSRPASFPPPISTPSSTPINEDPILKRLQKYNTSSFSSPISISTNPTLSSILRHFPTSPDVNPATYNYRATERTLAAAEEEEAVIAAGKADPRARKRAEKARLARAKREEVRRRAAEEIESSQRLPPRIVSSQVGRGYEMETGAGTGEDRREVQSSQARAGSAWDVGVTVGSTQLRSHEHGSGQEISMTQPERGAFGTRPHVAIAGFGKKKDKGKKRAAGF